MQQTVGPRQVAGPAILGLGLILVGGAALLARFAGYNVFEEIGPWGWPLFIIVPGLVLLAASLVPERPNGVGLAIAGGIVTAVGALLLYQWRTGHWESWAYAWALLPAAAGVAQILYGAFAMSREIVTRGVWMTAIAGLMFGVGAWFFEGLFSGEPRTFSGDWWAVGLIVIGGIIVAGAFLRPAAPVVPAAPPAAAPPVGPVDPVQPA